MNIKQAFKLFNLRTDNSIGSLFINRKQRISIGIWLKAENHPTKGYAIRPGWHVTLNPIAPHLSKKNRIWMIVEIKNYIKLIRPQLQGGTWFLANYMKVIKPLNPFHSLPANK